MIRKIEKEMVQDYVVFDLETTGFDAKNCEIIEIGALKYRNNKLVEEFDYLINPNVVIPSNITLLTGIDNEMVKNKLSIKEVLPEFIKFIEDLPLIAHNAKFDLSFLDENINRLNLNSLDNKYIDTVYLARKYIDGVSNCKLETLKKHFNLNYGSHRSLEDCYTTNYVYEYCKKRALITN